MLATLFLSLLSVQQVDLLIEAGVVVTMDDAQPLLEPGAVAIFGSKIVAVGAPAALRERFEAREELVRPDGILLPGLINTHTHAPMTLYRGLVDGLSLQDWLEQVVFPAEAIGTTEESVRAGTRLAMAELLRGGVTTFCDMYYFEEAMGEEVRAAGMRAILGQTVLDFPAPDAPTPDDALQRARGFLERFADDPRVTPAVAPHSTYTLGRETLKKCRALADEFGAPLVIHLSESASEVATVLERFGKRPIGLADELGILDGPTVAAHTVHLTDGEIALLARKGVGCCHCPQSNMKLGSGVAPVVKLLAAGVAVGLGTDGAASNDDLDLFEEIDTAAKLQKLAAAEPSVIRAETVLKMATIGGARALGLADRIGSLEAGKEADLILVAGDRPGFVPRGDIWSHLVYVAKGHDVEWVMVAGRVLLADSKLTTLDEAEDMASVARLRRELDEALRTK